MDPHHPDAEPIWYIARGGRSYGPYGLAELRAMLREGSVVPHDMAWTPGQGEDWRPLRDSLAGAAAGAAPGPAAAAAATVRVLPGPAPARKAARRPPAPAPPRQEARRPRGEPGRSAAAGAAPAARTAVAAPPRRGWIRRHWRGELGLGRSYWIDTVLVSVLVLGGLRALDAARAGLESDLEIGPRAHALILGAVLGCVALMTLWQVVGVWRSASRHAARGGFRVLGLLAKFLVVLQLLEAGLGLGFDGAPALVRAWQNTEPVPVAAWLVRPLRGGKELEFRGEIRPGAAAALERALAGPARGARVLHLTSPGGQLIEAHAMAAVVRRHGLATYVRAECVSACPLVFLAGRERVVREGGGGAPRRLGFHRPKDERDTPARQRAGLPMPPADRAAYRAAGVPEWFLDRIDATANAFVWWPTQEELVRANLVRVFSDGTAYSAGRPLRAPDRAAARAALAARLPAALRPLLAEGGEAATERMLDAVAALMRDGAAPEEVTDRALATLLPRALGLAARGGGGGGGADDAAAVALLRALARMEAVLAAANPGVCPALVRGGADTLGPEALRGLKASVRTGVLEALGRAAAAAAGGSDPALRRQAGGPPPPPPAAAAAPLVAGVKARLLQHPDAGLRAAAAALPGAPRAHAGGGRGAAAVTAEPWQYCVALQAFHEGIAALPAREAGLAARWLIAAP